MVEAAPRPAQGGADRPGQPRLSKGAQPTLIVFRVGTRLRRVRSQRKGRWVGSSLSELIISVRPRTPRSGAPTSYLPCPLPTGQRVKPLSDQPSFYCVPPPAT